MYVHMTDDGRTANPVSEYRRNRLETCLTAGPQHHRRVSTWKSLPSIERIESRWPCIWLSVYFKWALRTAVLLQDSLASSDDFINDWKLNLYTYKVTLYWIRVKDYCLQDFKIVVHEMFSNIISKPVSLSWFSDILDNTE